MQVGDVFGLGVIVSIGGRGVGGVAGQVKNRNEVRLPLMQVNRPGVYLEEGSAGFNGL